MRTWVAMSGWSVGDVDKEDDGRSTTPKTPRSKWLQDPMVKGRRGGRLAKMAEGWGRYGARSGLWETQPSTPPWQAEAKEDVMMMVNVRVETTYAGTKAVPRRYPYGHCCFVALSLG